MAGVTVNLVDFHAIKGDNVQISGKTASWNPVTNWAIAFSRDPLSVGVPVILEIDGSGHIGLGVIHKDPKVLTDRLLSRPTDIQEYSQINEVKVHKRKCSIRFTLEPGGKTIVTYYSGKTYKQSVIPGTKVWLAVHVKFGDITLKLSHDREAEVDYNPVISEVKGINLEFCSDGKNEVRTVSSNPAALCFIGKSLNIGEKMSFLCEPLKDIRGQLPRQFVLKIYVTNKNPKQLQQQYKNLFTITTTNKTVPQWVCSEVMERKNFSEQMTIERTVDSVIFTNGMNERIKEDISTYQRSELWIGLELYRVIVRQVEVCAVAMDTQDGAGDGYITSLSVAERSDVYLELKPDKQKKRKEIQWQKDKCCPIERNESAKSFLSVTGYDSDGYLTAVAVTQKNNEYLELIPEQQHKQYPHSEGIESIQSYAFVTGKDSDSKEEGISRIQSKPDLLIPAEDIVRFESSFNGHFVDLVKDLSALELCDHLISLQVITMPELEKINSKDTSRDQNRELLFLLCRKPVPRSKFIAALKDSGNGHLSKMFFPL
ncbi:hypothetical protein CHS0354_037278 [Potamilus streckersoni]|uniref:CARD domain-containing protein n=1 Tax=Potamilus streckersoni TaxID=2493646 RepID=A0AAE0W363_9BIVA|nr:hypothetical protein CHS0354_037278 [Potamilus streckersoni]